MLKDYELEFRMKAEEHGTKHLEIYPIHEIDYVANLEITLNPEEIVEEIKAIIKAYEKVNADDSLPWTKEKDPFEGL